MKLPDFSKCKIYKLVCKDLLIKECYVGHTCNWIHRKSEHKRSIINESRIEYFSNKSIFIRDNGGWNNWDMVLIEEYPCETRLEAHQRERYWMETLKASLNMTVPSRLEKEQKQIYYQQNKEHILQQCKEYVENNKQTRLQYQKEYREKNKDKIKEYYKEKKEERLNYQKEYREKNK